MRTKTKKQTKPTAKPKTKTNRHTLKNTAGNEPPIVSQKQINTCKNVFCDKYTKNVAPFFSPKKVPKKVSNSLHLCAFEMRKAGQLFHS